MNCPHGKQVSPAICRRYHDDDEGGNDVGTSVKVDRLPLCQFEHPRAKIVNARVDGKTRFGPWAYMCGAHFALNGVGLGTGKGQILLLDRETVDSVGISW